MPNHATLDNVDPAILGIAVSVGATTALLFARDKPVSAHNAISAVIGTTVVGYVWGVVGPDYFHAGRAIMLIGHMVFGAVGGVSVLNMAARYGKRFGENKLDEALGETTTKTVSTATVTETSEVKKP